MDLTVSPAVQRLVAVSGALALLAVAALQPAYLLLILPAAVAALAGLAFYQYPVALAWVLALCFGFGLDIQLDALTAAGGGGGTVATLGAAVVKVVPFALAGVLMLRYGLSPAVNWPILVYVAIAGLSVAILPIGRVAGYGDMVRSLIGSTAPFVIGLALAPRRVWTAVIRGAALVPVVSAVGSVFTDVAGFYPMFGFSGRFQGLHSAPFLAGFCVTAVFASTLEYLREFRRRWLLLAGAELAVLLATQARAPLIAVGLFLLLIFVLSGPRILPLKRKVDLVMGGMVPAALPAASPG